MSKVQGFTWTVADHDLLATTDTWGDALVDVARADKRIVAVTADLATTTKLARMKREIRQQCLGLTREVERAALVNAGLEAAEEGEAEPRHRPRQ